MTVGPACFYAFGIRAQHFSIGRCWNVFKNTIKEHIYRGTLNSLKPRPFPPSHTSKVVARIHCAWKMRCPLFPSMWNEESYGFIQVIIIHSVIASGNVHSVFFRSATRKFMVADCQGNDANYDLSISPVPPFALSCGWLEYTPVADWLKPCCVAWPEPLFLFPNLQSQDLIWTWEFFQRT